MKLRSPLLKLAFLFLILPVTSFAQFWDLIYGQSNRSNQLAKPAEASKIDIGAGCDFSLASCNDKVYLYGGWSIDHLGRASLSNRFFSFDISKGEWEQPEVKALENKMPGRCNHISFSYQNEIYIAFGLIQDSLKPFRKTNADIMRYSPDSLKFLSEAAYDEDQGEYPESRYSPVYWLHGDKLYVFGGVHLDRFGRRKRLNDFWEYSLKQKQWKLLRANDEAVTSSGLNQYLMSDSRNVQGKAITPLYVEGALFWTQEDDLFYRFSFRDVSYIHNSILCKYNTTLKEWSVVRTKRSNIGETGEIDNPGYREKSMVWKNGNRLYLYGGYSYDDQNRYGLMDDTWVLDLEKMVWKKISGNAANFAYSDLNTKSERVEQGTPGSRLGASACTLYKDNIHHNMLIGGLISERGDLKYRNDIWEFKNALKDPDASKMTTHKNKLLNTVSGVKNNHMDPIDENENVCPVHLVSNPSADYISVLSDRELNNFEYIILNTEGVMMQQELIPTLYHENEWKIDISRLKSGIYIIQYKTNNIPLCSDKFITNLYSY